MCGIVGVLHFDSGRPVDHALLQRMTDVLAHRGPDGRGVHVDGAAGLGHRRLAIIDLSAEASQPMTNEDGTVWVVFNGEIYNFKQLRDELLARGHAFRSRSDTEVLVHLYEEYGDDLVQRLRGMFAFAIWDARRRRLLLARDRFGQKPMYYRLDAGALRFASEVKAMLEDPEVPRAADPEAIDDYLTYGYVPDPGTAFAGIQKLSPGSLLAVEASGRHRLRRYWSLPLVPKHEVARTRWSMARVEEELLGLIDEAVSLRTVADVPLGALLSGGIDSSAIVASLCAQRGNGGARTFSIGFDDPDWNESAYAELVARHLGTEHEVLILQPEALPALERIAWHHSDPQADPSCLPTFAVCGLARRRVTVALSGDGGDELFCGYPQYRAAQVTELLQRLPGPLRAAAGSPYLIQALNRAGQRFLARQLAYNRGNGHQDPTDLHLARIELTSPAMKLDLYGSAFREAIGARDARRHLRGLIAASEGTTFVERCAHADAVSYLPDDILVKVDVASMAYGLECRSPFLDHVLAEYVARLPFELKMKRLETKHVIKRAVRRRLPRQTLERGKMGFGVPLRQWFREEVSTMLREIVLSPRALERGYFRPDAVRRLVDGSTRGKGEHHRLLFALLMLELWHRTFIDAPRGGGIPAPPPGAMAYAG